MTKPTCRICLETTNPENMINPCKCKGSIKWVHFNCLQEYRLRNVRKCVFKCELCNSMYRFKFEETAETLCAFKHLRERLGTWLIAFAFVYIIFVPKNFETLICNWFNHFHWLYMSTHTRKVNYKIAWVILQFFIYIVFVTWKPRIEEWAFAALCVLWWCEMYIYSHEQRSETVFNKSIMNIKRLLVPY